MRATLSVLIVCGLALGVGGCVGSGVTKEEKAETIERTARLTYEQAYKKAYELGLKQGMTEENAKEFAEDAAKKAEAITRQTLKDMIPVREEGGGGFGAIAASILQALVTIGLGVAKQKLG